MMTSLPRVLVGAEGAAVNRMAAHLFVAAVVAFVGPLTSRLLEPGRARSTTVSLTATASAPLIGLLGVADDTNSSFTQGPADAPPLIRDAMGSDSANAYSEIGIAATTYVDRGDLPQGCSQPDIAHAVASLLDDGLAPCILGGDHAISFPVIASVHAWRQEHLASPDFAILHFDAHSDTYDSLLGNRFSHACPFARVCELEPPPPLVQMGLRTLTPEQREHAARFGVEQNEVRDFPETRADLRARLAEWLPSRGGVLDLYVSVDIDALDPAHAPGVSHHEPGGLTTRQLLSVIQSLPPHVRLIGFDCVEYNPTRDVNGVTAMVAAKLCKELIGTIKRCAEVHGRPQMRRESTETGREHDA
jgi:arginase